MRPLPGMFRQKFEDKVHRKMREGSLIFIPIAIRYPKSGGIFRYSLGRLHPEKGLEYPEAIADLNVIKKISLGFVSAMAKKSALVSISGFVFLPWSKKIEVLEPLLQEYSRAAIYLVEHHYLLKRFYCVQAKQLRTLVYVFLKELGFSKFVCSHISDLAANFIQYDNAYRFIVADIFSEINRLLLLDNPRKEIKRILKIFEQRGGGKVKPIILILSVALLHPRVKKAFKRAVSVADIEKIGYDEADRYCALLFGPYKFMGAPIEVRKIAYIKSHQLAGHVQLPPMQEVSTL